MPTTRRYRRRLLRTALMPAEQLELWLGPGDRPGSTFRSRGELQLMWLRHRDRILERWGRHGRRPQAWWELEASIPYPGYFREKSTLWENGLLDPEERNEVEVEWRRQFDRAWSPDFAYCAGPGCIYQGAAGRRAHFRWADIPRRLVEEWTRQRKGCEGSSPHGSASSGSCAQTSEVGDLDAALQLNDAHA